MQVNHIPINEDGGGHLRVVAETAKDFQTLFLPPHGIFHRQVCPDMTTKPLEYGHFVADNLDDISRGAIFDYTHKPDKRMWYEHEGFAGMEFIKPYLDMLEKYTGYKWSNEDGPGELDLLEQVGMAKHTRFFSVFKLTSDMDVYYCGMDQAEPWNGMTACDYAASNLAKYARVDLGHKTVEPEYIENKNGTFSINPNPNRTLPPKPCVKNGPIWIHLFTWWRENIANEKQRHVLDSCDKLYEIVHKNSIRPCYHLRSAHGPTSPGYNIRYLDEDGNSDYTGKGVMTSVINWEEFRGLA